MLFQAAESHLQTDLYPDLNFLNTLMKRFDKGKDRLLRLLEHYSFGKAVRKAFWIGQPKYVRLAIQYFAKPFEGRVTGNSEQAGYIMRVLEHLKRLGIRKLKTGFLLYGRNVDGVYLVSTTKDLNYALANHERDFKITISTINSVIVECGLSISCSDYYKNSGLLGGGQVEEIKYRLVPYVLPGESAIFRITNVMGYEYDAKYMTCYERHSGVCDSYVSGVEIKINLKKIHRDDLNFYMFIVDEEKQVMTDVFRRTIKGQDYSFTFRFKAERAGMKSYYISFDHFVGAVHLEAFHKVKYSEIQQCDCRDVEGFGQARKSTKNRLWRTYYDSLQENGFSIVRPEHCSKLTDSQEQALSVFTKLGEFKAREEQENCSVCYENDGTLGEAGCGHYMCIHCFARNLEFRLNCPVCRQTYRKLDYRFSNDTFFCTYVFRLIVLPRLYDDNINELNNHIPVMFHVLVLNSQDIVRVTRRMKIGSQILMKGYRFRFRFDENLCYVNS